MFLKLNHKKLDVYKVAKSFVTECYQISKSFPPEEKFALVSQMRRAAVSVLLNLAEGASRKSKGERKRFYEIARGSLIEIDAAIEIASELNYLSGKDLSSFESLMIRTFQMLSRMMDKN